MLEQVERPRSTSATLVGRPLQVLLVVDSLNAGGAERYVVDLAIALRGRGHAVTVACAVGGVQEDDLREAGVPVRALVGTLVKRRVSVGYARALRRLVDELRPDVVHANVYASTVAAALATAGSGVPLVVTEHTEAPWRSPRARAASRWAHRRAHRLVAVSSAIRRGLCAGGVAPERVLCVPNAVPPAPPAALTAPLPARVAAGPLVGRVCRLAPEKGVDLFLAVAALVAPRAPRARFVVAGDGPCRAELEAQAATAGLADRVAFLGFRPDARAVIERLDVLVVSSLSEGAPLVVLEAMQAGVPVVASAVGGVPDQIDHGVDGLLVPPGDDAALAAAVEGLLADPARARRLGEAGRDRVAAHPHDELVGTLEALYRSAVAARAA
jgi:glycosyltransferase involved in cell wall biosynthesis